MKEVILSVLMGVTIISTAIAIIYYEMRYR
jgi:hypothetical protein